MVKTGSQGLQGGWHRLLLQRVLPWGASASGAALSPPPLRAARWHWQEEVPVPSRPRSVPSEGQPLSNPSRSSCSCWQAELCSVQAFISSCLEEGLLPTLSPRLGQVRAPCASATWPQPQGPWAARGDSTDGLGGLGSSTHLLFVQYLVFYKSRVQ